MAKKKPKREHKDSTAMKIAKIAVPAAIGAVAGALGLRWVDRTFGSKLPASVAPEPQQQLPEQTPVDNPMAHPLAAAAISPVVMAPMPVYPSVQHHWPGYPGNPGGSPAAAPPHHAAAPELPDPESEERERAREFDELVAAFESGQVSFH